MKFSCCLRLFGEIRCEKRNRPTRHDENSEQFAFQGLSYLRRMVAAHIRRTKDSIKSRSCGMLGGLLPRRPLI